MLGYWGNLGVGLDLGYELGLKPVILGSVAKG